MALALGVSLEMGLLILTSLAITRTNKTHVDDADAEFVSKVLGTTEDHWHKVFQAEGRTYHEPKLVFYTGRTQTGCGLGKHRLVPFYCPTDKKDLFGYELLQGINNQIQG